MNALINVANTTTPELNAYFDAQASIFARLRKEMKEDKDGTFLRLRNTLKSGTPGRIIEGQFEIK